MDKNPNDIANTLVSFESIDPLGQLKGEFESPLSIKGEYNIHPNNLCIEYHTKTTFYHFKLL